MNSTKIRTKALQRGITSLYHFTPFGNLRSILETGLLSRKELDARGIDYFYTDEWRNDGQLDAVSLSIHDINRSMFSSKLKNSSCDWVILEIDASVLWTHPCWFCWVNASSSEIVNHKGFIGGPWAFNEMFEDRTVGVLDKRSSREVFNTPTNMPTMNDAEVQVRASIPPELIRDVSIAHDKHRAATEAAMTTASRVLPIAVTPDAFAM